MKRRHLFLLLLCSLIAACGRASRSSSGKMVFRFNLAGSNLESLDPAYSKELSATWINHMIYNTLVETDEQLHIVPSLASSWDISADGLTYTFHLRSNVYFHNNELFHGGKGRRMTAADVVYSFARIIDPHTASPGAWIFNGRVAAGQPFVAIDDTTLEIRLSAPFRPLPELLSMAYCNIVPHEVAEHWGKDFRSHPCGTGPFMLGYWDEGNALNLLRNPAYWECDSTGRALPCADAVSVSFADSKATEFLLFRQHRLDFINGLDGSFKDLVLTKSGTLKSQFSKQFKLDKSTYLNTEYIGFLTDTTNPLLATEASRSVLIRRAINHAINRQKIVTYFKNGVGIPATHGFIPPGMPGYDTGSHGYNYDPELTQKLLAAAGYPGGKGMKQLTILVQDNYVDIVNFIVSELAEAGIPAKIEVMQPGLLKQQMSRAQAIAFRAQWIADYPDAESFMAFFNSRQPAPPNYTRFSNAQFDKWYYESQNLPDKLRWQQYRKMDSLAMSYAPIIPLYYDEQLHFTQNNVTGLRTNAMNLIDVKRVTIK